MGFLKKYWYLLLVTLLTIGIGVVAYLTSTQLENKQSVAPTVPQVTPKASDVAACKLSFSITLDTPTPTATGVQNTPTPTATGVPNSTSTPTPTVTPTTQANNTTPECTGITLSPGSGTAPYTTTVTCSGKDTDGDITAVEFTLPDGSTKLVEKNVGSPGSLSTDYTVTSNSSLSFSCRVRDNNFAFSSVPDVCKTGIGPTGIPGPTNTPGPTPTPQTPKIPVSGGPTVLGATTIVGGILLLLLGLAF